MPTCGRYDLVVVPFPFLERPRAKMRPALALTDGTFALAHGQAVLAMITSARHSSWTSDVQLADWREAGLTAPSRLRWKLFTLPLTAIAGRLGTLSARDRAAVLASLGRLLRLTPANPAEPA